MRKLIRERPTYTDSEKREGSMQCLRGEGVRRETATKILASVVGDLSHGESYRLSHSKEKKKKRQTPEGGGKREIEAYSGEESGKTKSGSGALG